MNVCKVSLCLSPEGDRQFFIAWFSLSLQNNNGMFSALDTFDRLMTACTRKTLSDGSVAFLWGLQNWEAESFETQLLKKSIALVAPEHHKFLVVSEKEEIVIESGAFGHAEFKLLFKRHG